jgi:glycosyltransferase involved in cell wall biosynthesis
VTRRILLLLPHARPSAAQRQVELLAQQLPRDRFTAHLAVLAAERAGAAPLPPLAVTPISLNFHRVLDLQAMRRLAAVIEQFRPDVIHAWRWPAALAVRGLTHGPFWPETVPQPLIVLSEPLRECATWPWLGHRLLPAGRLVAQGPAEVAALSAVGLPGPTAVVIPPAAVSPVPVDRAARLAELGLPATARVIVAAGQFRRDKDFRQAAWSFDMLSYQNQDAWLLLAGDGPEEPRLRWFVRSLRENDSRVRFCGWRADLPELLGIADVVWITGSAGGRGLALEAMAAGVPVVGPRRPDLAELVDDEAGVLVPASPTGYAKTTRVLLEDTARRQQIGHAGRDRVAVHFTPRQMVDAYARLYEG